MAYVKDLENITHVSLFYIFQFRLLSYSSLEDLC